MVKVLNKVFFFLCLLGGIYSQAMGLEAVIEREYAAFQGRRIPDSADQPCKAIQFIYYLQENAATDGNAARKIALIIGSGVGVGGISENEATPAERALMVRGLNFAVRQKATHGLNLDFKGGNDPIGQHQTVVARLIESSQKVQRSRLKEVDRNAMYYDSFPKAPVLHPYQPELGNDMWEGQQRVLVDIVPVKQKLETASSRSLLPLVIQQQLAAIPDVSVDVFFVAQAYISAADGSQDLLFRPQYWLDPDAPLQAAGYSKGFDPYISFWQTPTGTTINHDSGVFYDAGFSTHMGDGDIIVSSEANCSIEGFIAGKRGKSVAFWSITSYGGRYALTLHWLLDKGDAQAVHDMAGYGTVGAFSDRIAAHPTLKTLYSPF